MTQILILDDEPTILAVLKEVLINEGYRVFTATNGLGGLEILKKGVKPDLILVDLYMPWMSGKKFVETIKSTPELRSIPVLIMTGAIINNTNLPAPDLFQDIIEKPFDIFNLMNKIEIILNSSETLLSVTAKKA